MRKPPKEQVRQGLALAGLLLLTGFAIAGPTGLLAWSENVSKLDQHQTHIAHLQEKRDELKNRVDLLDPNAADPDLVGELLRRDMNMVHPDEVVITLDQD
ncbi:FtsB family cell division protein [Erythrobacter sp. HA6-11]